MSGEGGENSEVEDDECPNAKKTHRRRKAQVVRMHTTVPQSKVRELVGEVSKDSSRVFFTAHAEERMAERGVTRIQVLRCLEHGRITPGYPQKSEDKDNWLVKLEVVSAGDVIKVIAALDFDQKTGDYVVVITTYR